MPTDFSTNFTTLMSTFISLLQSVWTAISSNWFLLGAVAIPFVIGIFAAVWAIFRRGG